MRQCQALVIWTDCDREGENIGFEIIDVCKAGAICVSVSVCDMFSHVCVMFTRVFISLSSVKHNIQVFRAKFSEITPNSIRRACETLTEPGVNISDAVDIRQELDLRIGKDTCCLSDTLPTEGLGNSFT